MVFSQGKSAGAGICSSAVHTKHNSTVFCLLHGPKRITKLTLCSFQCMPATTVKQTCKYYGRIFGSNSTPHSSFLCLHPCRVSINITMSNCMPTSVQETKKHDKQIFMKFDIGEFYEKLLSHFNFPTD
jgi:hypothetical protein